MSKIKCLDGGQIVLTQNVDDDTFDNIVVSTMHSYPGVNNVYRIEDPVGFRADLSNWKYENVITLTIKTYNAKRLVDFYFYRKRTKTYSVIFTVVYLLFVFHGFYLYVTPFLLTSLSF